MNTKLNKRKMMIKISVQPWDVSMYTPYIMYGIRTIYGILCIWLFECIHHAGVGKDEGFYVLAVF